jgi:hypothetical protein
MTTTTGANEISISAVGICLRLTLIGLNYPAPSPVPLVLFHGFSKLVDFWSNRDGCCWQWLFGTWRY